MLIITVESENPRVTLRLEGPLAGLGARELARAWLAAAFARPRRRVSVDLTGVTFVDAVGKDVLTQVHQHGDTLVGGATTISILREITGGPEV